MGIDHDTTASLPDSEPDSDSWKSRIGVIVELFRQMWKEGKRETVEHFLGRLQPDERGRALPDLIAMEISLRNGPEDSCDRHEYLARFPNSASVIEQTFQQIGEVDWIVTTQQADTFDAVASDIRLIDRQEMPGRLGRFRIEQPIGSGSFGIVYRAFDLESSQTVALKFPRRRTISSPTQLRRFLDEANQARRLEHPGIVRTFGAELIDGFVFIVQQLVEGQNLQKRFDSIEVQAGVKILAQVAEAAAYAHQQGFIHRDLKPSNILVATEGQTYIADFGLVLHIDQQSDARGQCFGAPAYMSPEQVQGLAHRLDGRSDIWSIGIMLYELLTGRRPFRGNTRMELFEEIKYREAWPPRMINPRIDSRIQAICLRCLGKSPRDRYLSADELADDLRHWLRGPMPNEGDRRIIPRGLHPYTADDAEFFLKLLPGPRDRNDIPECVRFWKARIESESLPQSFSIGLIFGPSGCGKTSLVNAGLLPLIDPEKVTAVRVECTANATEKQILQTLSQCLALPPECDGLASTFNHLRTREVPSEDRKVLIVLDQFEQWLYSASHPIRTELVEALRHCDGIHLQCLLMVRDDFWIAISRFMNLLDIDVREGENARRVDRFELDHARLILTEFGRAFRQLPDDLASMSRDQEEFVDQVIQQLAEQNRIVCMRLSLFVEMFKGRAWTRHELANVGGIAGIGERFLEESFSGPNASPQYRTHIRAAQAVLQELLPEPGRQIRGHLRTSGQLLRASAYESNPQAFAELMHLLVNDLRLISPSEANAELADLPNGGHRSTAYQLTHDYLVPPIRGWITQNTRATWHGRASLRLHELEELWNQSRQTRYLPGPIELLQIGCAVPRYRRSPQANRMMRIAATRYVGFIAIALFLVTAFGWIANTISQRRQQKYTALQEMLSASAGEVERCAQRLVPYRDAVMPALRQALNAENRLHQLRAAYAIVRLEDRFNANAFATTGRLIPSLDREEFANVVQMFRTAPGESLEFLCEEAARDQAARHLTRLATLELCLGGSRLLDGLTKDGSNPQPVAEFVREFRAWYTGGMDIAAIFRSLASSDSIYTLTIALANQDAGRVPPAERQACLDVFKRLYRSHADAGVHNGARWAIEALDGELPTLPIDLHPPTDRDWWLVSLGGLPIEFVRLRPGSFVRGEAGDPLLTFRWYPVAQVDITNEVWIASIETPMAILEKWVSRPEAASVRDRFQHEMQQWPPRANLTSADCPGYGLAFDDIALLCNWLTETSMLEGRPSVAAEYCYQLQDGHYVLERNRFGVRLPTPDEWEYACRAGAKTRYWWGSDSDHATSRLFSVFSAPGADFAPPERIRSRIPNRWGLFDCAGNVWELARDYRDQEIDELRCFCRGGSSSSDIRAMVVAFVIENGPDSIMTHQGFRLVIDSPQ